MRSTFKTCAFGGVVAGGSVGCISRSHAVTSAHLGITSWNYARRPVNFHRAIRRGTRVASNATFKGKGMKLVVATLCVAALAACTSTNVRPVESLSDIKQVCIQDNPAVIVEDFVTVVRDGFDRHGIATSVVDANGAKQCEVTLTYTALRSWDFKPYLSHAELRLWRGGRQIGSADYHLNGKGGFALTKWQGTKAKMDPVIDQLLGGTGSNG